MMNTTNLDVKRDGYKKKIVESSKKNCLTDRLFVEVKPEDVLFSGVPKPQTSSFCIRKLFLQHIHDLTKNIPKQIASLEEKFLNRCLELIHTGASRKNNWIIPSKSKDFSPVVSGGSDCDSSFLVSLGAPNADISAYCDLIFDSITSSTSMMDISNNHSICQLDALDDDVEKTSTLEIREHMNSAVGLHVGPLNDRKIERILPEYQALESESLHKMLVSLSNADSGLPDVSSSSSSVYRHGTLHCSWNDGFPHYTFSLEDKRKVLITTNLLKVDSFGHKNKAVDYVYTFHSIAKEADLLGEMSVSTSFEICPHGTEVRETRFVLCAIGDNTEGHAYLSDSARRKNNYISKKVGNIYRGHSCKLRLEPGHHDGGHLFPPKLELATIVTRHHIHDSQNEVEFGGWGLKFLKNDKHCESCVHNTSYCSTSMNVLIPAGFHSRPRTGNSGSPSSLIERWSGGSCDCGGWDLGCPLTVLHAQLNHENGDSFDLFKQGCKNTAPVLKMVDVRECDGQYGIGYKSSLSALQSLSIAVAAIHSRSPSLRPRLYAN